MPKLGAGEYTYELIRDFLRMPPGESLGKARSGTVWSELARG